jgi:hypothetical protein
MCPEIKPAQEHQWLLKLVGAWVYESECNMGPDQPAMKTTGTEVVRSLGDLWMVAEGEGGTPDGRWNSLMTLGYDPQTQTFVGTFVASMMTHLWVYSGSLDGPAKVLTLDTEGPNFTDGKMTKYQDIIEIVDDNHRTLSSQTLGEDGQWHPFMKGHYRRKT